MRGDAAALHLDQPSHEREADAEAALRAVERALELRERLEHHRQRARGDAHAGVAHAEHGIATFVRQLDLDLAARVRVLRRIVDQVAEHLREAREVAADADRLSAAA